MDNKPIRILLIEDNAGDARIIQEQLKEVPDISFVLERVAQLQEGLVYLSQHETDVVLSDLSLPDSPGLETFKRLQAEVSKIPVVVVTGFDNESAALDAVREGAQDYLIKGQVDARGLSRTILYAIERHRTQSTLLNLSLTDELTRLYNRRGFMTLGEQALKSAQRSKSALYLYYADMDGLKKINDTFGHPDGDRAIAGAAEVLRKTFRQSDIVARIGGDEFAILAAEEQSGGPEILISRLQANLAHYNLEHPQAYVLSMSIGVTRFNPNAPVSIEELMTQSDKVLYVSKGKKKATVPQQKNKTGWLLTAAMLGVAAVGLEKMPRWKTRVPPIVPNRARAVLPHAVPALPPIPAPHPAPTPPTPAVAPPPPVEARAKPRPVAAPFALPPETDWKSPTPPAVSLHQELIPKNITITRISYQPSIVSPGAVVAFKIVGSGFTAEFQQVVTIYSGSPHVQVKNLRRVTVNEIRGEMVVHATAPTQYVFPHVLINETPVFQAANPFAIIRRGEVLNIVFTKMEDNGHVGHFRVYTNLDSELARQFHIVASADNVEIAPLEFALPYRAEGTLRISDSVPRGDYGLAAYLGAQAVFRKDHLIQVTRPMLGSTGFVQAVTAQVPFRRPGDTVTLVIQGSGFTPGLAALLKAKIEGLTTDETAFRYVSPGRLEGPVVIPAQAPEKSYMVTLYQGREEMYRAQNVFSVVPPNWMESLEVTPEARPGRKCALKLVGRDFSHDFARTLRFETDEPGIHIARPKWVNASTLVADLAIDDVVNPGDYVINLRAGDSVVKPNGGNLITISAP